MDVQTYIKKYTLTAVPGSSVLCMYVCMYVLCMSVLLHLLRTGGWGGKEARSGWFVLVF